MFDKAFASFDEVSNYMKGDITSLRSSASAIERTAKDMCNDPEGYRIEFCVRENGNVFIDTTDDEALECLFRGFEKEKKSIHDTNRTTIQQMLDNYEQNRAKYIS